MKTLFIGCDHAAYDAKSKLLDHLKNHFQVVDLGTHSSDRCNYPDYAKSVCEKVIHEDALGLLICGSGIGMSMAANRYAGIRAALCTSVEEGRLSKQHNDANILCLGARLSESPEALLEIILAWHEADFEQGRHTERIALFNDLGEKL